MFSGSAVLGSNLGNAMMPGIGSLHQIREALHLQDVGQARAALQKPTTSQQKPQSRAMAGPCHLVQDDIPGRNASPRQTVRVSAPHRPAGSVPVPGSLGRARSSLLGGGGGPSERSVPGLSVSWRAAPLTVAGASPAASQRALPPLGAPPLPPQHGPHAGQPPAALPDSGAQAPR